MKEKIKNLIKLGKGKLRRFYLGTFRKKEVEKMLERRKGNCRQCGACCKLLFKCPFLIEESENKYSCKIYGKVRPVNCVIFPINETDLEERDIINPNVKCGYFFELKDELKKSKK